MSAFALNRREGSLASAVWCIHALAQINGLPGGLATGVVSHQAGRCTVADFVEQALSVGLRCRVNPVGRLALGQIRVPVVLLLADGTYCILAQVNADVSPSQVLIHKPGQTPMTLSADDVSGLSVVCWMAVSRVTSGVVERGYAAEGRAGEGWSGEGWSGEGWLSAVLQPCRAMLFEVLLLSGLVQALAMVTPLFFQVLMDKVLVSRAQSTFQVIVAGLLIAALFEMLLTAARGYLLTDVASRTDSELGRRLWSHVVRLPLGYFQSRPAADVLARFRELEHLRQFITGAGLTAVLDLLFSVAFLALMFFYQATLAAWVSGMLLIQLFIAVLVGPVMRRRLARRNSTALGLHGFLVEAIQSIATIKSLGLAQHGVNRWHQLDAQHLGASMSHAQCAVWVHAGLSTVSRLSSIGVMGIGASAVMTGQLTVGEMVAFNMLATHVATPVLRLSQWWQDLEQVRLAHGHVEDVFRIPVERSIVGTDQPALLGHIRFDQVSMRFRQTGPDVLAGFDLEIRAGEMVALVGPSGCGKSTVAHLLQRLCIPAQGRIVLDGQDLSLFPLDMLRTQIGVVSQDTQLFAGSIAYNIAICNPSAAMTDIVQAAKWADAHDFICGLPDGYETQLAQGGVGLSGGQRQRIGIARVLAARPRLLVFDEATSALDVETEIRVCQRLRSLTRGRTTLVIAHRLSTVLMADRVVVMQAGRVRESGSPRHLLSDARSEFYRMYRLQQLGPQIALAQADAVANRSAPGQSGQLSAGAP